MTSALAFVSLSALCGNPDADALLKQGFNLLDVQHITGPVSISL